jgi:uncharacterized membrane protein YjjB (DUF3815 family)
VIGLFGVVFSAIGGIGFLVVNDARSSDLCFLVMLTGAGLVLIQTLITV